MKKFLPPYVAPPSDKVASFRIPVSWFITDEPRFMALMEEASKLVAGGIHFGDNLFTWGRNNSMFDDVAFRDAWQDNVRNSADRAIVWRRYVLATMGYHAVQLEGDFVECGVYQGTGVKTVVDYLGGKDFPKTFWAFDTFDYNAVEGHDFEGQDQVSSQSVRARFAGYDQVRVVPGLIPAIFAEHCPERIAYLHIDLNDAAAELATLEHLFDRVVPGGVVILDDYEWAGRYRSQKLAEDPWFDARGYRATPLPTGQALLIKR